MNDETGSFEKRLKRQTRLPVPAEWRKEILRAAGETDRIHQAAKVAEDSFLASLYRRLASVLWPHPVAWAGLAAIWLLIFAVNYSSRDTQPVVAEKMTPPSPEVMAELRQQHRLFVELTGGNDSSDADRPKAFVPRPRSERVTILTA